MYVKVTVCTLGLLLAAVSIHAGEANLGRSLYQKRCAICHGRNGRANGRVAGYLRPRPRDLVREAYKFRSTQVGEPPLVEDVLRTLRHGLPGSSMPAWAGLQNEEAQALAEYSLALSERYRDTEVDPDTVIRPPEDTARGNAERGRTVYNRLKCGECHGEQGRGDVAAINTLKDEAGRRIVGTDLRFPSRFKGGSRSEDVYRTFMTGIDGTPMPSYFGSINEQQALDLVSYVLSLSLEGR